MRRRAILAAPAAGLLLGWPMARAQRPGPVIAVAASVQAAMEEIALGWRHATGNQLSIAYGASGNFVRQIQQGLPAELFLSADEAFPLRLADAGLTRDRGLVYASGRLALVVPLESTLALDAQLQGLKSGWEKVRKFAIANPELAPYGKAAREVLQATGLWERAQAKLVLGENIGQATQFVTTGAAEAGLTSLSLLVAGEAARRSRHVAMPDSMHAPLRQRMVLLKNAGPVAAAFYQYLQGESAQALLRRHGFTTAAAN